MMPVFPPHLSSAAVQNRKPRRQCTDALCNVHASQSNCCSTIDFLSPKPCP